MTGRVRVSSYAVSIDGFGAGPDQSLQNPLGVGGEALHAWFFPTETFQKMYADAGVKDLVTLNVAPGQGHNYWEGFFRCEPLIEFAIERARAGAK